jgi:hypothetical protein
LSINCAFSTISAVGGFGLITNAEQEKLKKPNPPTAEMVEKAQFIDKTYIWKHAGVRPGDERSSQ